jgi:squalene-associated FAD-dependent desaturase
MPDVVVIGGGFAGLSAAVALAKGGARVEVIEARPQLGGRATSFRDRYTGEHVDNGQHVLFGCYRQTFDFLDAIGSASLVQLQSGLSVPFIDRKGHSSELRCPALPAPWHLVGGIMEWSALGWEDRLAALSLARPLKLARLALANGGGHLTASPGETVESWLERNGQTARLREMLWEPLALAALNQSPRRAAAPPFVRVLAELFGDDRRDAAIGLPLAPLDALYATPAARAIESFGGTIRLGAPARVSVARGRADVLLRTGEAVRAEAVVAAVPWHALPDLFDPAPPALGPLLAAARSTAASPIATVNLWLDKPVLRTPFLGLPGRRMHWIFDKGLLWGDEASHLSMVSSGADEVAALPNEELIALATTELFDALPDARRAAIVRASVVRERRATFSIAPDQPRRPSTCTAISNLFLAGDWIDTGLPATIEGAVRSGNKAAAIALNYLGARMGPAPALTHAGH